VSPALEEADSAKSVCRAIPGLEGGKADGVAMRDCWVPMAVLLPWSSKTARGQVAQQ
jgi:hypothetical protein